MKRLAAQLSSTILAALFSLMTLATVSADAADADGAQDLAEPATPGTAFRFLAFAVRFVTARLFWGS
ncbi:MAG TPA: hypothetical protein VGK45_05090 [Thermoanaerobaculia bacterium]